MESKPWYLSKTIWGAVIAFLGMACPKAVAALGGDNATDMVLSIIGGIVTSAGSVLAVYGRYRAQTGIGKSDALTPQSPMQTGAP